MATSAGPADPRATELARRFRRHLERSGLIEHGSAVLVATSGGVDSVALLHLLRFAVPDLGLTVKAAHFDHAMRAGSAADAAWVAGLCRAWDVPLHAARAQRPPRSEAEARDLRYAFLDEAAVEAGADVVATAHHADDQAETVLFRALRGAGLAGLAGIPERRGRFVRPLLPFSRAEIEAYADAVGLRHREDPSNRYLGYTRNRLRHEALPLLETIVPGAGRALARLARLARDDEDAWRDVVTRLADEVVRDRDEDRIELARPGFLAYHPAIRARLLRHLLKELGVVPDRAGTTAALEFTSFGASGGSIEVGRGVRLERDFDRLTIRRSAGQALAPTDQPVTIPAAGDGSGRAVLGGRPFVVRWTLGPDVPEGDTQTFDPEKLRFPLLVRAWQPGDRIRLPAGTKKLKKLFAERRVARGARSRTPVLVDADGNVLWVVRLARAVSARADDAPALTIAVQDAGPEHG